MTQNSPPGRRLVRLETVAASYDLSVKILRQWIAEGRIKAYRVGTKAIRVDLAEFEAVMVAPVTRTGDR